MAVDTGIACGPATHSTAGVPGSHCGSSSMPGSVPRPMELSYDRSGSGETVVLIHGVGSFWQAWKPVVTAIRGERDVIGIDLPGFGASPTLPIGVVPTAPALADAVADFLSGLGAEKPVVAGNSLGGWVALELARRGRARAMVAVPPAGFGNRIEAQVARAQLRASWRGAQLPGLVEPLIRRPRGRVLTQRNIIGKPKQIPAAEAIAAARNLAASAGFDGTVNTIARQRFSGGEEVAVPVALVWGTRDMILYPWQAKRALKELPRARLARLPGAGHVPMWDAPEAIARELLAA
jgi:pimeloyl-ACP methyl ester carboxylesterase